ncbi:MAG: RNA 2',3'-cyclic phosphodiesterase, partial [Candidatus Korarchaeota archaeon]|nr:RNA 2',3'-cyclic phosphodiesterase [Candidatus Korarchaeota archaeon]NIU84486.1 RNA 2',3'-cyclic phosphodiesterase [Candidatus Thorarchaeota archaeon]
MAESVRSFVSFDIENEAILGRILEVQKALNNTGANLKLVKPQNVHVTIRFLGNINPPMIKKIYEEMKKVQFSPFNFKIEGVGVFPSFNYMRIVWAGVTEGSDEMRNIFSQLEPRLRKLGFSPDRKGFSPHITIARVKSGRNKDELAKCIKENINREFGTITAECLRL